MKSARALLEHVVAQVHDEVVVAEEVAGDQHAVGEAQRIVLRDVGDLARRALPSPTASTISSAGLAHDDADLLDARLDHVVDAVEEDRLVGDGDELLGARVGDRPQAGARAAGEDEALHGETSVAAPEARRRNRPGWRAGLVSTGS